MGPITTETTATRETRRPLPPAPISDDSYPQSSMRVTKRNGTRESVDLNKIVRAVSRCCVGLSDVDPLRVATKTINGLYDGATTRELDQLSIQTAAALIADEPQYAKLGARLLATYIEKEVRNQEIHAFSQSIARGHELGLVNDRLRALVANNARKLNDALMPERDHEFEYFGLRTLYDRYLLKHPSSRLVIETPQQFFMRIACALSDSVAEALELYATFSSLAYIPSSPTLFNAGTRHEQLSSCLRSKMNDAERHLVQRLVAFFATGDSIVANNLVLSLYRHINAPEARMYLSRQLYEEALHVQFYLTLLDTYVPDPDERHRAFAAIENIPSIQQKAAFCIRWLDAMQDIDRLDTRERQRRFLLNLICFAACVEGLFFFGAFAYVYFLRSRGLLHGLAAGTNWVFRDESAHMAFAFSVIDTVRREQPELFDAELTSQVTQMLEEAVECETQFAHDLLGGGIAGISVRDVRTYLEFCADRRLATLAMPVCYRSKNPFDFMDLQDVQEVTNFFERRVSAYQVGVTGEVVLNGAF